MISTLGRSGGARKVISAVAVCVLFTSCDKAPAIELILAGGIPPPTDTPVTFGPDKGQFGPGMSITAQNVLYTERYTAAGGRVVDARKLNGDTLWSVSVGCTLEPCPLLSDSAGDVIVAGANKTVAVRSSNGSQIWRISIEAQALAIGSSSRIFASSATGLSSPATVFAIDAGTGETVWQTNVPNTNVIRVLADAVRGNVYVLSKGGATALSAATGTVKWTTSANCFNQSEGAIAADGTLYVTCDLDMSAMLYAYASDGTKKWSFSLSPSPSVLPPVIDAAGNIYVADEANVTSLSPAGALRWRATGLRNSLSAPVIDKAGNVFILASPSLAADTHLYIVRDGAIVGDKGMFKSIIRGTFALTPTGAVYYAGGSLIYFQSAGFDPAAQWPQPGRNAQRFFSR